MMCPEVRVPFTDAQVHTLNRFQHVGWFHPFTCGRRAEHPQNEGRLYAMTDGWHCPASGCEYRQYWAHGFMADREWIERMHASHDRLFAGAIREDEA